MIEHAGPNDRSNTDVVASLRDLLAPSGGFPPIREICRQPSEYRSSFALEEITVTFADGSRQTVMFKDLGWQSLTVAARQAKPSLLYDPLREIEVYRHVLDGQSLGSPRCYGTIVDPSRERYWLFIEKAPGAELYQYGEMEIWGRAARWLANLHYDADVGSAAETIRSRLVRYDADYFRYWIGRAVDFAGRRRSVDEVEPLAALARNYDAVVEFLVALPVGFIHGEFYASNVLVDPSQQPPRVAAIDWELAGIGPGVIDLAALVVGKWKRSERAKLIGAYRAGLPTEHPWSSDQEALDQAVAVAKLHLAVQWLGWSPDWTPPAAHAHDWFDEAIGGAERLGLL